jgi:bifunctional non-homologous end joining protein LigD
VAKLQEYKRKRKFARTPEPPGGPGAPPGRRFVVQKHSARRLHYDLRLEVDGVLKSWAVPKGPTLDPGEKRLAVQTEDHPLEYGKFEGVIPEGNYGAGTVMVWDRGLYDVEGGGRAADELARGELKFALAGEKLRGGFVLVKLKRSEKGNEWLLIKHRDAAADPAWKIEEHDGSALTGRRIEEIAENLPPHRAPAPIAPEEVTDARRAALPASLEPMLAMPSEEPFSDPNWLFEIKWDGVRALAWVEGGRVTLRSRSGRVITGQYPELEALPARLRATRALLDGEIVVLDERGRGDFERLQERMHVRAPSAAQLTKAPVTYFVFDLLSCDGYDLREAPLAERKALLERLLLPDARLRYCDHQAELGRELFELARANGLEGIVAKRADSRYVAGRSPLWLKLKARRELDAVVGGWTEPRAGREHFGSLVVGLYDGPRLRWIGHVGSGFDQKALKGIFAKLEARETVECPFDTVPETNERAWWARPEIVARVEYAGWTQEQRLRHPSFVGLREDANPLECLWEGEVPAARQAAAAAPAVVGRVLNRKAQVEAELFRGTAESVTVEMEGKRFRLVNLNKVFFPEPGYTKRHLLAYYYRAAELVLPFLKDRPMVLRRYPDGISGLSFFQKEAGEAMPEWMETVSIASEGRGQDIRYVLANDLPALLYLTNLGCVDHNPWSSRTDDLEHPDFFFFDLDPADGTEFRAVVTIARALYEKLAGLGLRVFIKTSGATGMHLYLPVERGYTYDEVRMFAEIVARMVAAEKPKLVTPERAVAKRAAGRIYIDVSQNAYGRPLAAAYVVRPFPPAPVATPLEPEELRDDLAPESLNIKTIFPRLEEKGDLWGDFWRSRQRLEKALAALSAQVPHKAGRQGG